jgi:hypothetical protein
MVITCLGFDELFRNNYNRLEIIMQHFCWSPIPLLSLLPVQIMYTYTYKDGEVVLQRP